MEIQHMVYGFLHSLKVAPLHLKTLSQLQMLVQQYLYHSLVTAEDAAVAGSLVHEYKIWKFHIAEISDLGMIP